MSHQEPQKPPGARTVETTEATKPQKPPGARTKKKNAQKKMPKKIPLQILIPKPKIKTLNPEHLKSKSLRMASVFIYPLVISMSDCLDVLFECGRPRGCGEHVSTDEVFQWCSKVQAISATWAAVGF